MALLIPSSLETNCPPLRVRVDCMIGYPRGEGGHPLALMINGGCLRR